MADKQKKTKQKKNTRMKKEKKTPTLPLPRD
jgi:hypothetical protein